jgi:L-alanine-DL-glutamate epimerase-like enolase superfamily enzyme
MTITDVSTTAICLPIPPGSYASDHAGTKREWGRLSRLSPKRPSTVLEYLIVRIETDEGAIGIGEAPVDIGFFGQTLEEVQAAIDDYLGPQLAGLDPFDREYAMHRIDYRGNSCARSGIDLALHDLMGRALGVPVSDLIGGSHRDRVQAAI